MTDWAALRDAYGSAEQVPALLMAAEESGDFGDAWDDLWSHLCHQGTVYSASYAVIPLLADLCSRLPVRGYRSGLQLAGSILASTDGPSSHAQVRATYAEAISQMRDIAEAALPLAADDAEFIYALETLAAFEDLGVWQRTLNYLADGEAPLTCGECAEELLLQLDGAPPQVATWNAAHGTRDVMATEPPAGTPEARLMFLAQMHERTAVAEGLRFYFGASTCPACGGQLQIADAFA